LQSNPQQDIIEMMAAQEDCRDYLRTGRCKYGASCKYNHPPNVQSGGGIRDPNNPSEPQFPIRRGEPTCQYYLKHGTCKFGQACKFHHPPHSEMAAAVNMGGSSVIMNMGRNKGASQQIVLNTVDGSGGTSAMALQFLPQRPDEPDCIYFLRNGRCKYGATCRYHHPVSFSQNKSVGTSETQERRQPQRPQEGSDMGSRVRSASSLQMAASEDLQGSSSRFSGPSSLGSMPTHYVITETPLAVVAGNATGRSNSYSRVTMSNSASNGEDFMIPLNTSGGLGYPAPRDFNSSSSSIASSYETSTSAVEYQGEQNGVIWSRPVKRIGSGGSLSAYDTTPPLRPQPSYSKVAGLPPSVSDNSIASRRLRAESMGSASDYSSGHPDAWNQNAQAPPSTGWVESSSSFEQARRAKNAQLLRGGDRRIPHDASGHLQHGSAYRSDTRRAPMQGETHDDGGLSMMTSALLNMLDTPEEVGTNRFPYNDAPSRMNPISPPTTPRSGHVSYRQDRPSGPLEDRYLGSPATGQEEYNRVIGRTDSQASRYDFTSREYTHTAFPEHLRARAPGSPYSPLSRPSAMQDPSRDPSKSSNVGLYLP
jgi:translation initiation factor 4G